VLVRVRSGTEKDREHRITVRMKHRIEPAAARWTRSLLRATTIPTNRTHVSTRQRFAGGLSAAAAIPVTLGEARLQQRPPDKARDKAAAARRLSRGKQAAAPKGDDGISPVSLSSRALGQSAASRESASQCEPNRAPRPSV